MAKPLLQGTMLLLAVLLLAATIQAGPAMAWEWEQVLDGLLEKARDLVGNKAPEKGANMALTELGKKNGWKEFSNGGKKGIKFHKYFCKAQGWMDKQNPGPGGANLVVVDTLATTTSSGLGRGGYLSMSFPTFSYWVTSEQGSVDFCWSPEQEQPQVPAAATTTTLVPSPRYPNDGRYYVRISGIRVGQEELPVQTPAELNRPPPPPAYLSTAQPYTYLRSSLYGRLREAVILQTNALNLEAPPYLITTTVAAELCYAAAAASVTPRLPGIAILLASNNNAMQMELGGAVDTVWYRRESSMICLGILPTMEEPVLGSMIQRGRTMTIDLTAAGGLGTLTF